MATRDPMGLRELAWAAVHEAVQREVTGIAEAMVGEILRARPQIRELLGQIDRSRIAGGAAEDGRG